MLCAHTCLQMSAQAGLILTVHYKGVVQPVSPQSRLCMPMLQEFPTVSKQEKWSSGRPAIDWDKVIKEVLDKGKEVPEIDWAKPGQDAAWKVSTGTFKSLLCMRSTL